MGCLPIMQCENGHHLCAPCRKNVAMCPVCRAPKGNNRNLALEKLAESTLFLCKYRSKGFTASLLIADKKGHENSCERGFACSGWVRTHPYPSNRKKVSVDDLVVQIAEKKMMEFIYEIVLDHATNTDPLLHNVVRRFQGCSDKSFLLRNPAMTLQAALDDVRLTDRPYDEEPLDLNVPEAIAFATRKMEVKPFFVPSIEINSTTASGWCLRFDNPGR
ncbi:hypothetical protein MRX96_052462 [Rhipicephalus microplus]